MNSKRRSAKQILENNFVWVAFTIASTFFTAGLAVGTQFTKTNEKSLQAQARITSPSQLVQVSQFIDVSGTHNLTSDHSIWVAVFSYQLNRYFPHRFPAEIASATDWVVSDVQVGTTDEDNASFEVVVFLVDDRGRNALGEYFDAVDAEGFHSPLRGMTEQDRVTVTRRRSA